MSGWEGHAKRECRKHRSTGGRAWCFDCSEWCYPATLCARCELPLLLAERDRLREALVTIAAMRQEADEWEHSDFDWRMLARKQERVARATLDYGDSTGVTNEEAVRDAEAALEDHYAYGSDDG